MQSSPGIGTWLPLRHVSLLPPAKYGKTCATDATDGSWEACTLGGVLDSPGASALATVAAPTTSTPLRVQPMRLLRRLPRCALSTFDPPCISVARPGRPAGRGPTAR